MDFLEIPGDSYELKAFFVVEQAGIHEVNGVYRRTSKRYGGVDVFKKPGTPFALLRKEGTWCLADLGRVTCQTWTLTSVELYRSSRSPAGNTPPKEGWHLVEGVMPLPVVRPAKASVKSTISRLPHPSASQDAFQNAGSPGNLVRSKSPGNLVRSKSSGSLSRQASSVPTLLPRVGSTGGFGSTAAGQRRGAIGGPQLPDDAMSRDVGDHFEADGLSPGGGFGRFSGVDPPSWTQQARREARAARSLSLGGTGGAGGAGAGTTFATRLRMLARKQNKPVPDSLNKRLSRGSVMAMMGLSEDVEDIIRPPPVPGAVGQFHLHWRVTLHRPNARVKWGIQWDRDAYMQSGARLVTKVEVDTPAARWNAWQEVRGRPELMILPGDRLLRVDGRWAFCEAEMGSQDGDFASEAVKSTDSVGHTKGCLVVELVRRTRRMRAAQAPEISNKPHAAMGLIVSWREIMNECPVPPWGFACALFDHDSGQWMVVDGNSRVAAPLQAAAMTVAFPSDATGVDVLQGLSPGRLYSASVAVLTDLGWSAFSMQSRAVELPGTKSRLKASRAMPGLVPSPVQGDVSGDNLVHFTMPSEIKPGITAPVALDQRALTFTEVMPKLVIHMVVPGADAEHIACESDDRGLLTVTKADLPPGYESLKLHGIEVPLAFVRGDRLLRANGLNNCTDMAAEVRRQPEQLAVTVGRSMGETAGQTYLELDTRLDGMISQAVEEISLYQHLEEDEASLALAITEYDVAQLEQSFRVAGAASEFTMPPGRYDSLLASAEQRLTHFWKQEKEMMFVASAGRPCTPDEMVLTTLRTAMADVASEPELLQTAMIRFERTSKSIRLSTTARGIMTRAAALRELWTWRLKLGEAFTELKNTIEAYSQLEEDRLNDNLTMERDLTRLKNAVQAAKPYASEMAFVFSEGKMIMSRLEIDNKSRAAAGRLMEIIADPHLGDEVMKEAAEHALSVGVGEGAVAAAVDSMYVYQTKMTALESQETLRRGKVEMRQHIENRAGPGAGTKTQRRLRHALSKANLPDDNPLAEEAIMLLKRWEDDNGALRSEARLLSATERVLKGYTPKEPDAGTHLSNAIAEVRNQGIEPTSIDKAYKALDFWHRSRRKSIDGDLRKALGFRDKDLLKEKLEQARGAGCDRALIDSADETLRFLNMKDGIEAGLSSAMEESTSAADGGIEMLEQAVRRAQSELFEESQSALLLSAVLQLRLRFWIVEFGEVLRRQHAIGLGSDVKVVDALLSQSEKALEVLRDKKGPRVPEVAVRGLSNVVRALRLVMPQIHFLASVSEATAEIKRVLGAVERCAADLPEAVRNAEAQVPNGLDPALVEEGKAHLSAYYEKVARMEKVLAKGTRIKSTELKTAIIEGRLVGAPDHLLQTATDALFEMDRRQWEKLNIELKFLVAIQEADDVLDMDVDGRFMRLQDARSEAEAIVPPLKSDIFQQADDINMCLAAERALTSRVTQARDMLSGVVPSRPKELNKVADDISFALEEAKKTALPEAVNQLGPVSLDLIDRLRAEATVREKILETVQHEVSSLEEGAQTEPLRQAIVNALNSFLPTDDFKFGVKKISERKLEYLHTDLRAALHSGRIAVATGLQRRSYHLINDNTPLPEYDGFRTVMSGSFVAGANGGGSFGTLDWRKHPYYVIRPAKSYDSQEFSYMEESKDFSSSTQQYSSSKEFSSTQQYSSSKEFSSSTKEHTSSQTYSSSKDHQFVRDVPSRSSHEFISRDSYDSLRDTSLTGTMSTFAENVSVAVVETGMSPSTVAVHVVRNRHDIAEAAQTAGYPWILGPDCEVLAQSVPTEDLAACTFSIRDEDSRPIFVVPSAAKGDVGGFELVVCCPAQLEVIEVTGIDRNPWRFEKSFEVKWAKERPYSKHLGGKRPMKGAPTISWYRNPQFRVTYTDDSSAEYGSAIAGAKEGDFDEQFLFADGEAEEDEREALGMEEEYANMEFPMMDPYENRQNIFLSGGKRVCERDSLRESAADASTQVPEASLFFSEPSGSLHMQESLPKSPPEQSSRCSTTEGERHDRRKDLHTPGAESTRCSTEESSRLNRTPNRNMVPRPLSGTRPPMPEEGELGEGYDDEQFDSLMAEPEEAIRDEQFPPPPLPPPPFVFDREDREDMAFESMSERCRSSEDAVGASVELTPPPLLLAVLSPAEGRRPEANAAMHIVENRPRETTDDNLTIVESLRGHTLVANSGPYVCQTELGVACLLRRGEDCAKFIVPSLEAKTETGVYTLTIFSTAESTKVMEAT